MTEEVEWCEVQNADGSFVRVRGQRWKSGGSHVDFTVPNYIPLRQVGGPAGKWLPAVAKLWIFLAAGEEAPTRSRPLDPRLEVVVVPFGESVLIPEDVSRAIQTVNADGMCIGGLAPQLLRVRSGVAEAPKLHPAIDPSRRPRPAPSDPKKLSRLMQLASGKASS